MTEKEYEELCKHTKPGTPMTFSYRDKEIRGEFIGCAENAVVIKANGRSFVWPRELCSYRKSTYPTPSYS